MGNVEKNELFLLGAIFGTSYNYTKALELWARNEETYNMASSILDFYNVPFEKKDESLRKWVIKIKSLEDTSNFLEKFGLEPKNLTSQNKKVPSFLFGCDIEEKVSFLLGIYESAGLFRLRPISQGEDLSLSVCNGQIKLYVEEFDEEWGGFIKELIRPFIKKEGEGLFSENTHLVGRGELYKEYIISLMVFIRMIYSLKESLMKYNKMNKLLSNTKGIYEKLL